MSAGRGTLRMRAARGGIGVRIVYIVATLAVVAGAIFWVLDTRQKDQEKLNRKATEISEYGLLAALGRLKDNPSWQEGIARTEYEDGWYATTVQRQTKQDTSLLVVEATGHRGSVTKKQQCVLRLVVSGRDSVWIRQSMK
jgi:hypothetical protein